MRAAILLVFFLVILHDTLTSQCHDKIDPICEKMGQNQPKFTYFVMMNHSGSLRLPSKSLPKNVKARRMYDALLTQSDISQSSLIAYLKEKKIQFRPYYLINGIAITSDLVTLYTLSCRNDVKQIIYDVPLRMQDITEERVQNNLRNLQPEWGIIKIKADSVWKMGINGNGVTVGGLDTGVAWEVEPIKRQYRGYKNDSLVDHNYNWHDAIHEHDTHFPDSTANPCGISILAPCDDNNHGTHTVGTMIGQDTINAIGVAPGAKWIACRNMERGYGKLSTYIECFEWMLAPYSEGNEPNPDYAPHVINNSWYCSVEEGCTEASYEIFNMAIEHLKAAGIFVSVSAGNDGPSCGSAIGPPGFLEPSFSVGATNDRDTIASFSSRGPIVIDSSFRMKPNVVAPGARVRSVIRNGGFANFSGTSMASPHVCGVVALMISANPALAGHVDIIEGILEATAVPLTAQDTCFGFSALEVPNPIYGYGRIDALAAVKAARLTEVESYQTTNYDIRLYPNPTYNILTVECNQEIYSLSIYDQMGRVVASDHVAGYTKEINVQHFANGFYILKAYTKDNFVSTQFIKL
ncbi:MAG: S8 family peptidase [Saprospiraceae bacterium]